MQTWPTPNTCVCLGMGVSHASSHQGGKLGLTLGQSSATASSQTAVRAALGL